MSEPNSNRHLSKRTLLILLICGAVIYSSIVTAVGFFVLRQRSVPALNPSEEVVPPEKVEQPASGQTTMALPLQSVNTMVLTTAGSNDSSS